MVSGDLMWAYVEGGCVLSGKPPYDDPAEWVKRVHKNVLHLQIFKLGITGEAGDHGWTLEFENLGTAGVSTWRQRGHVRSVALVLTGLSDQVDAEALRHCQWASAGFFPAETLRTTISQLRRPAAIQLSADHETYSNRLLNTITLALAEALFEKEKVTTTRPPMSAESLPGGDGVFAEHTYGAVGQFLSKRQLNWSTVYSDPISQQLIGNFHQFTLGVAVGSTTCIPAIAGQEFRVLWQPFGRTTGIAMIYNATTAAQEPEAALLLLTGLDLEDDRAAIMAYEKQVNARGISVEWSKAFRDIATAPRPLLLRFLNDQAELSEPGDQISRCFAAAYFRHTKVL